ncbi:MAG: MlaD family protein [Gammaproteobacteria bacterium]|nr:MlaD family protein [Gammaproteobacteria bacterium]
MESRASYLLIGSFVLLVIAGLFGFVVWLAKVNINQEFAYYDIYFDGSVSGLGLGGDVRYRGIRVGSVTAIGVDRKDPSRVHVTIELGAETPIREGDEASLQLQGITGVSFVNIEGAGPQSPLLKAAKGETRAVIPSRQSAIEQLVTGAPEAIARAVVVMERFAELLNEDNQRSVGAILADVATVTDALASRQHQIVRVIDAVDAFSAELTTTAASVSSIAVKMDGLIDDTQRTLGTLRSMVAGADGVMRDDVGGLIKDLRATTQELQALAHDAGEILQENREPINTFASDGLSQMTKFLTEASILVTSMTRLTERLETEGARFLIGAKKSEFRVDKP